VTQTGAERCYLGVDAGTGSARAGVFDSSGKMLGQCVKDITTWQPESDFVEQSSADIWEACCQAVKGALGSAGTRAEHVRGIGFAATCSLVVLGGRDEPVTVSPTGKDNQNVIVWMDHRAIDQARRINATGHKALDYVGGKISPEMQSPKLLWLKENMPETWKRAERFFDLADFLTYRATGDDGRSLCTTVCKWTYLGHAEATVPGSTGRWDDSYWQRIGLGELVDEGHRRLGRTVRPLGEPLGRGLATRAAAELGLVAGIPVGVSAIDAHAGGIVLFKTARIHRLGHRRARGGNRPAGCTTGRAPPIARGYGRPACAHHGDVKLSHGKRARGQAHPRRVGALLFGHDSWNVAQRGGGNRQRGPLWTTSSSPMPGEQSLGLKQRSLGRPSMSY
jgi:FGGY-family pentulose kinase